MAVAILCYVQTAGYGFVWDDNQQIVGNDRITSFAHAREAFGEPFWAFYDPNLRGHYYRPLQTLSYMTGYALGGISPGTYHWLNIILHGLAALALLWLGWELTGSATIAFWSAMLFAAHPMHTESVAWCAGITDLGCGLFYFVALASYVRASRGGERWLWLSGAAFLAALLFKETALTLPVMAVAYVWMLRDRSRPPSWYGRLLRWLPLALALAVYLALRINALGSLSTGAHDIPLALWDRVLTLIYLIGLYVAKLILPIGHNANHVFEPFSRLEPARWAPPLILVALCTALVAGLRRHKLPLFLAGFVLVSLAPVLSLERVGQNVFAERYLYLPSAGFCLFITTLAVRFGGKALFRRGGRVLAGATVAVYTLLTVVRNPVWRDEKTFYTATLAISPGAAMMHQNLGALLYREKQLPAALGEFEAARASSARAFIRSGRDTCNALVGIATVYLDMGRLEEAWQAAGAARDVDPGSQEAYFILGTVRSRQARDAEAEPLLAKAVALKPGDLAAQVNLGSVLLFRGKVAEAEEHFRSALALDPRSIPARLGLAMCRQQSGRQLEALRIVNEVLQEQPGNANARRLLDGIRASAEGRR
jgi:Tfp pilus assembly protein PilF